MVNRQLFQGFLILNDSVAKINAKEIQVQTSTCRTMDGIPSSSKPV